MKIWAEQCNTYVRIILPMGRRSLRDKILRTGMRVMFRSGYQGASVHDICAAAGVPQGSFTNHFRSKEAFAAEVLDRYFDYLKGLVRQVLNDETLTPRQRLKRYLDIITGKLERDRWRIGCLIGDSSLEASSQNKRLREQLDAIFKSGARYLRRALRRPSLPAKSIQRLMPQNWPNSYWRPGKERFYE
jgi:TetR/AcrR family transcriptional repressor of nem operon